MTAADVPQLMKTPSGIPAKLTAPASGLFLARVTYPGDAAGPGAAAATHALTWSKGVKVEESDPATLEDFFDPQTVSTPT